MRIKLTALVLLIFSCSTRAQVVLEQYGGIAMPFNLASGSTPVYHYSGKVGMFKAIDVDQMKSEPERFWIFSNTVNSSLFLGHKVSAPNNTFLQLQLAYSHVVNKSDLQGVVFSDMIDPDRGFVKASVYKSGTKWYKFNLINFDLLGGVTLGGEKYHHSFSCGLRSSLMLSSNYFIRAKNSSTGKDMYFNDYDLKFQDQVYNFSPMFRYDFDPSMKRFGNVFWLSVTQKTLVQMGVKSNRVLNSGYPQINHMLIVELGASFVFKRAVVDDSTTSDES